jgi:hypothetical protein
MASILHVLFSLWHVVCGRAAKPGSGLAQSLQWLVLRGGWPTNRGLIPGRIKNFLFPKASHCGSGVLLTFCPFFVGGVFPWSEITHCWNLSSYLNVTPTLRARGGSSSLSDTSSWRSASVSMSNFTFTVNVRDSNANVQVFITLCLISIAPCCRFLLGPIQVQWSKCVTEFWTSNKFIDRICSGSDLLL